MSERIRDIIGKFPMGNLTLNEEKVWTILKDFSNGIKAKFLMQLTELSKTTLYECLDSLAEKGIVENKNRKWYPKSEEKPSTEKPSKFGFFDWLKWKREYNDLQLDREIRELDSEFKTLLEQAQLNEDDSEFLKKCEEIEDKYKRKYGLA